MILYLFLPIAIIVTGHPPRFPDELFHDRRCTRDVAEFDLAEIVVSEDEVWAIVEVSAHKYSGAPVTPGRYSRGEDGELVPNPEVHGAQNALLIPN